MSTETMTFAPYSLDATNIEVSSGVLSIKLASYSFLQEYSNIHLTT